MGLTTTQYKMAEVKNKVNLIEKKEDYEKLVNDTKDKLILVDFYAEWCPPCKMIAPHLVILAEANENVYFGKVDVDKTKIFARLNKLNVCQHLSFIKTVKKLTELKEQVKIKLKKSSMTINEKINEILSF